MNCPPQADMACTREHSTTSTDVEVEVLGAPPAIGPMIARAAARGVIPRRSGSAVALQLPARRVVLCDQRVDIERLAAYARVCAFTLRDALPTTYLHVLTFPPQIHLLATPDFPLPALGMVHLSNDMTLLRPVGVGDTLTLTSWAQHLRPHRKGATVQMVGEVAVEDEIVWRGVSTYLAKGASAPEQADEDDDQHNHNGPVGDGGNAESAGQGDPPPRAPDAEGQRAKPPADLPASWATWRCPADLGRRYAAASGDVNPIHVNPLAARAFGFPGTIAHGMWTHARALAALEGRLEDRHTVAVEFRKPIMLPSAVTFRAVSHDDGYDFAVTDRSGERSHMVGRVTNN
ncbi:MAG: MaoC/PaaZ C-terminal domain-containing protein [Ornithinimicrobium sp.]